MSIDEVPPDSSSAWGIAQCGWACGEPGMSARPEVPPMYVCTSEATMRPARAEITVLICPAFCTSDCTSSTTTAPGFSTTP